MHGIKWLHPYNYGLKVLCDAGTCQMMHGSMHHLAAAGIGLNHSFAHACMHALCYTVMSHKSLQNN